jgi:hypothetical protein
MYSGALILISLSNWDLLLFVIIFFIVNTSSSFDSPDLDLDSTADTSVLGTTDVGTSTDTISSGPI